MVSLQKNYLEKEPYKGFEETYKSAYSHGLEAIYALERVDIRSVRPLEKPIQKPENRSKPRQKYANEPLRQLEFDFGPGFRDWMKPFLLKEPIQVLELSKQAEKCLINHGKTCLHHLLEYDLSGLVFFKGIGQGHLDEIQTKLKLYLANKEASKATSIDFGSWMRTLVSSSLSRKKLFVFLEDYHLSGLVPLTPIETMEARRLTPEKRDLWKKEGKEELSHHYQTVHKEIQEICEAFLKPWMARRLGIATADEMKERLERISENPELASQVMILFSDLYCDHTYFWAAQIPQIESDLFCMDSYTKKMYALVIDRALTYFYKSGLTYGLHELIKLISCECARYWVGFAEGFIEKVLKLASFFYVEKNERGKLLIYRSKV